MKFCPTDGDLQRLIADNLSADQQQAIESHLTHCPQCQRRLDLLGDVESAEMVLRSRTAQKDSTFLRRAIQLLQTDAPSANGSTAHERRSVDQSLPQLPPSKLANIGRLGDIEIKRVIGRGGMGVVYEGWDTTLERTVAVKVLAPHLLGDTDAKNRFLREARSAAALTHAGVVTIHAITETDGLPYLVLQYVRGESLADRLQRESKLPFDDVVRIGIQVAKGLAAAHERGLIHRDIKPANILLDADSQVARIADFGLAKKVGMASMTQEGMLAGTPAFMSPEQAADAVVDSRSDLFSLGVVLYYASCGQLPFPAESPFVLLQQIRTLEPRPLQEVNPDLPTWFCSIVHRLLAKQPNDRMASAQELANALQHKNIIAAPKPIPWRSITKYAVLALMLVAGIYIASQSSSIRRRPAKSSFNGFQVVAVGDKVGEYLTFAEAVAAAPDGGSILVYGDGPFATPTIKIENKRLTIAAAEGSSPRFVPLTSGKSGPVQCINSNAELHLEGLDIDWPVATLPYRPSEEILPRCVIAMADGPLTIQRCRVVCGENALGVGSLGTTVRLLRSQFNATSGAGLVWRPTLTSTELHVEQCVFEGQTALSLISHAGMGPITVNVAHNTLATKWAWRVFVENRAPQSVPLKFDHNVVDCATVVAMTAGRNYTANPANGLSMTDELRAMFHWSDDGNVYRAGTVYFTGSKAPQIMMFVASRLKQIDQWLNFWNIAKSTSIEAAVRFQPRAAESLPLRVAAFESPTGPSPPLAGANADQVGPTEKH